MTKVILKKAYMIKKTGSRYPRGEYELESLPKAIRQDPNYVQTITEIKTSVEKDDERLLNRKEPSVKKIKATSYAPKLALNVNEATIDDLLQLPGIARKRAENIIANRPYIDMEDLKKRAGLTALNVDELEWRVAPVSAKTEVSAMSIKPEKVTHKPDTPSNRRVDKKEREKKKLELIAKDKENAS